MRKIKFRAKDKANNKWIYGNLEIPLLNQNISKCYIVGYSYGQYQKHEVDRKTVGEFTGLQDSNGKEIYEGDLFEKQYGPNDYRIVKMIFNFNLGRFDLVDKRGGISFGYDAKHLSIIGNIYDNPELIK